MYAPPLVSSLPGRSTKARPLTAILTLSSRGFAPRRASATVIYSSAVGLVFQRVRAQAEPFGRYGAQAWTFPVGPWNTDGLIVIPDDLSDVQFENDLSCLGAMEVLREAGRRIPDDVAVIGFDDILEATLVEARHSTRQEIETLCLDLARAVLADRAS